MLALPCAALLFGGVACDRARLDADLCPRSGAPTRNTVLLLDTSDPLSDKHRAELRRMVGELQSADHEHRVAPSEALFVYDVAAGADKPLLKVCNPGGHPDEYRWWDGLWRGRALDMRRWRRFDELIEGLFSEIEANTGRSRSPILETIGVVVARHVPSVRLGGGKAGRSHLVVFSDLLQHSDDLSHYGPYPKPKAIPRALRTDLTGVDVSLYRLERSREARWQTKEHYYWWTELVGSLSGRIVWQQSL